jgi:hypothetical protein
VAQADLRGWGTEDVKMAQQGISRRTLIKGAAVAGGVAWVAPTVLSVTGASAGTGVTKTEIVLTCGGTVTFAGVKAPTASLVLACSGGSLTFSYADGSYKEHGPVSVSYKAGSTSDIVLYGYGTNELEIEITNVAPACGKAAPGTQTIQAAAGPLFGPPTYSRSTTPVLSGVVAFGDACK